MSYEAMTMWLEHHAAPGTDPHVLETQLTEYLNGLNLLPGMLDDEFRYNFAGAVKNWIYNQINCQYILARSCPNSITLRPCGDSVDGLLSGTMCICVEDD
jgi:hypothetical protein